MLGFAGAHRSGKTTTAKMVAEGLDFAYFDGSFGRAAKLAGYNSVASMTVDRRIEMQEKVLAMHLALIHELPRPAISDRTPLDFIAYALADVPMNADISPELSRRIAAYVESCIRATDENYGAIAILQPLPIYKAEEGKPPACVAYQTHIQLLIEGALWRMSRNVRMCRVESMHLHTRIQTVTGFFAETMLAIDSERQAGVFH